MHVTVTRPMIICAAVGLLVGFLIGSRLRLYELKTVTTTWGASGRRGSHQSVHVYRLNKLTGSTWEQSGGTWKRIANE